LEKSGLELRFASYRVRHSVEALGDALELIVFMRPIRSAYVAQMLLYEQLAKPAGTLPHNKAGSQPQTLLLTVQFQCPASYLPRHHREH